MSTSNEIRKYLSIMRGKKPTKSTNINEGKMTMRNMLGKMRNLKNQKSAVQEESEEIEKVINVEKATNIDQKEEEDKMNRYFDQNNVSIEYKELEVYNNGVFWGGTIDQQIEFVFTVTPQEETSNIEVNYLEGFDIKDPENEEVIKKLDNYYSDFYKFWRNNELQDSN